MDDALTFSNQAKNFSIRTSKSVSHTSLVPSSVKLSSIELNQIFQQAVFFQRVERLHRIAWMNNNIESAKSDQLQCKHEYRFPTLSWWLAASRGVLYHNRSAWVKALGSHHLGASVASSVNDEKYCGRVACRRRASDRQTSQWLKSTGSPQQKGIGKAIISISKGIQR